MELVNKVKNAEFWFLLLIVIGYVFVASIAIPLDIEEKSRYFAVPFRFLIFLYSAFIIYRNFNWEKLKNISVISLLLFWIFYLFKVWYSFNHDAYAENVLKSWNETYVRIPVILVIPSLALMFIDYRKVDFKTLSIYLFYGFLGILTLNLIYGFVNSVVFLKWPFIFTVYYISYGHYGTSLAIISLFFLLFTKYSKKEFFIYLVALFIGCFTVFIATARSPFLALALVSFFLLLVKRDLKLIVLYFIVLALAVFGIWLYVESGHNEIKFIVRTYNWLFEGDNSLRTPLFERSIELFKESPLIGSRILYEDGMYPHNIFLELLMATGIVGLFIYFLKFIPVAKTLKIYLTRQKNIYYILFFALFLQYFVLVFTSYNLFSVPEFVHLSALIIGISLNYTNEET